MSIVGAIRACEEYLQASEKANVDGPGMAQLVKQQHEVLLKFIVKTKTDKDDGTRSMELLGGETFRWSVEQKKALVTAITTKIATVEDAVSYTHLTLPTKA